MSAFKKSFVEFETANEYQPKNKQFTYNNQRLQQQQLFFSRQQLLLKSQQPLSTDSAKAVHKPTIAE